MLAETKSLIPSADEYLSETSTTPYFWVFGRNDVRMAVREVLDAAIVQAFQLWGTDNNACKKTVSNARTLRSMLYPFSTRKQKVSKELI